MSNPIRAFARMARASGFSREDTEVRMQHFAGPELTRALDDAYAENVDTLQRVYLAAAFGEAEAAIEAGKGKNVDAHGFDEADRAAIAVLRAMDDDL